MNSNETSTSLDPDVLLWKITDEKAQILIPAMIYIGLVALIGFVGNVMVVYFYGWKTKPSPTQTFILALATFDLVVCVISMPMEIADLRFFYTFNSVAPCKIFRYLNYVAAFASVFVLLAISTDRFRKVCHPFSEQMTTKLARIICAICVSVALVFSSPGLVFNNVENINVTNSYSIMLEGRECRTTKDPNYKPFVLAFNVFQFFLLFVSIVALSVLYTRIAKEIYNHRKSFLARPKSQLIYQMDDKSNSAGSTETSCASNRSPNQNGGALDKSNKTLTVEYVDVKKREPQNSPPRQKQRVMSKLQREREHTLGKQTIKFTGMLFVVTAVFIVGFIPYISLQIWRIFNKNYEANFLTDTALVWVEIGKRSYFISSCSNPFIYGMFNSEFRNYFCSCCSKRSSI